MYALYITSSNNVSVGGLIRIIKNISMPAKVLWSSSQAQNSSIWSTPVTGPLAWYRTLVARQYPTVPRNISFVVRITRRETTWVNIWSRMLFSGLEWAACTDVETQCTYHSLYGVFQIISRARAVFNTLSLADNPTGNKSHGHKCCEE